ncbi:MAG: SdrD B-like domain-containing protein, partial [Actinomycetota bacterium]
SPTGVPPSLGDPVVGSDPSHYFGAGGGLQVEKSTNGQDADVPPGPSITEDEPVNWTYVVTNTGNVTVNNIVVSDDQGVVVTCPTDTLAPGASLTCTGSGTATVGQYANIGSATGQPVDGNGNPVGDPVGGSDPSHYLGEPLAGAIIGDRVWLDENGNGLQDPGEPGVPGRTVNLWVDEDGDGTPDVIIATTTTDANGNYSFADLDPRLTYFIQVVPVPGAPFTPPNQGDDQLDSDVDPATGISPPIVLDPGQSDLTIDAGVLDLQAGVSIEKTTNGQDADTPTGPVIPVGSPVEWRYAITNNGDFPLVDVAVVDDQGVTVSCPMTTLDPGESMVCTGSGVATAGQYSNLGTVSGQPTDPNTGDPFGGPISGSDPSHYFGGGGGLVIEKSTNGQDADVPPGPSITEDRPVNWTYTVTNTGNLTVTGVSVSDDQGVAVTCPTDTLAPGESLTCTGSGTATVGQYANIGSATGQPVDGDGNPVGDPIGDTDPSHYLGEPIATAALGDRVFLDENRNGVQDPGERGVGDRVVNLWTDDDGDGAPDVIIATATTDVNGNYLFTDLDPRLVYFIQIPPVPGEPYVLPNQGDDAIDSDVDPVTGIAGPITLNPGETNLTVDAGVLKLKADVRIEKSTNGLDADMPPGPVIAVGDTVNWTYVVSNPGEYPLVDIAVTDDQGVVVTCPMTTLAVGESMTCTGTGVATGGQYENIGSVSAQPTDPNTGEPFGLPTVNIDPSHYFGAGGGLRVEKSTNGVDADTPTGPQLIEGTPIT